MTQGDLAFGKFMIMTVFLLAGLVPIFMRYGDGWEPRNWKKELVFWAWPTFWSLPVIIKAYIFCFS